MRAPARDAAPLYLRHALPVRIMHWINVVALTLMFMSGLQIFNAHPALYWGNSSYSGTPRVARDRRAGSGRTAVRSATRACSDASSDTTGVLGLSTDDGRDVRAGRSRRG